MDNTPPGSAPVRTPLIRLGWLWLLLTVAAVFHEVPRHRFVNYDDPMYLYENGHVTAGWTGEGLRWAWTNKDALQWHPLTWMGHMLVSELAGMRPGAHLAVNLALHALNAVLLLHLLTVLTQAPGRSLAVALLFAVHPVNVETAAWASQLKSTLSTGCALLGFLAYARHARDGRAGFAVLAAGAMTLSLLAKPMMVTFPVLLVLLDFWPLRRLPGSRAPEQVAWLKGKAVYFLLAAAMATVAALPWGSRPEMSPVSWPDPARLTVVPVYYVRYLMLMLHPADLAVLYPERLDHGVMETLLALSGLIGFSIVAWSLRARHPALLFGWLWFLITLLPVGGIFRLGPHGTADRYLYVPGIGVLIALVWPLADFLRPRPRWLAGCLLAVAAGLAAVLATLQIRHWRNSLTLWRHAVALTPLSATSQINLGEGWLEAGQTDEAIQAFVTASNLEPANPRPYINLAAITARNGPPEQAEEYLRKALDLDPRDARVWSSLGAVLSDQGKNAEAGELLRRAVALDPHLFEAQLNLGTVLVALGERGEAEACFERALRIKPGDARAAHNLRLVRSGR